MVRHKKFLASDEIKEIVDLYGTREFSKNELAGRYGISVAKVTNLTVGMPEPYKVKDKASRESLLSEHILESFDNDIKVLVETIDANMYGNKSKKNACYDVVQGGCLLCYYSQVNDFLEQFGCNAGNDYINWEVYKKIIVETMYKMYTKFQKEAK